jgi:TDG/mug DNA glycosylase family protein
LGQQFWKLLVHYGVLPQPEPGQFHDELLLQHGFGITDLVKVPSARANGLAKEDVEHGRSVLLKKIEALRPAAVCSVYKSAIEPLYPGTLENCWGLQDRRIGDAQVFVLPFPYRSAGLIETQMPQLKALARDDVHG